MAMMTAGTAPMPDLKAKLAFLERREAYPDGPARVDIVETHLSWVFLTPDRVYKLKKPVAHEYVDLSTIDAREWNCREELRLNRRLAPEIYLAVVPLTMSASMGLQIGGDGAPVDWLVVMKRLPAEASLQARLVGGHASRDDIERIAGRLASFDRDADRAPTGPVEYIRGFREHIDRECDILLEPVLDLPGDRIRAVRERAMVLLDRHAEALRARAEDGHIVEAHGDLRPEHVFLLPEPVIIDCLEFNRRLRLLDPLEELGYLAMECAHLGAHWVGDVLFATYRASGADPAPAVLVPFYQCCRALLRTRLAITHLKDGVVRDPAKWRLQAAGYLALAERYAETPIKIPRRAGNYGRDHGA